EKLKKDRRDFLKNEKITNKKRENTNKKELAKSLKREMNYSMLLGNAKMRIQKDLMKNNSAQKFRKSKTILNIYNSKKEYNKISDWLDLKLVELSYIEKFYTLFQERGKALVGETFENNRIVGFQGNAFTIHFMGEGKEGYSSSANLRSVGIDDLSHDFLIVLFKKMVTPAETSYNLYLAYYLLYNMDFASAMKVQPNNSQIKSTIGLYYRAQLENVKTLFAYRKYISKTQTRYLQQLYADTPWRKQLDKDLSQIMTSYQSKVPE
ncbi:MAG: hypothetical protein U9O87_10085, partial [Verrucomicrobiota bacterium]|nr:hypothetical protein [Verrucomicrobiota bacterium]